MIAFKKHKRKGNVERERERETNREIERVREREKERERQTAEEIICIVLSSTGNVKVGLDLIDKAPTHSFIRYLNIDLGLKACKSIE